MLIASGIFFARLTLATVSGAARKRVTATAVQYLDTALTCRRKCSTTQTVSAQSVRPRLGQGSLHREHPDRGRNAESE